MAQFSNVTVVGVQWGDEGKGKVVDWLAAGAGSAGGAPGGGGRFAAVVRFNGGHNAGHTLVSGDRVVKVALVPSGVLADTPGVIGNGVVVDPAALIDEIDRLTREGLEVSPATLTVADTATLTLPSHRALDAARESCPHGGLGTTGRGIGPAYEDKVARRAVRVCDLADAGYLRSRVAALVRHHNVQLRECGATEADPGEATEQLLAVSRRIQPFVDRCAPKLWQLQRQGGRLLFEGAQSVLLDVDHGTYPYVTSSNCVAGAAAAGAGVGPRDTGLVIGVAKAYTTRVGEGPLPTELIAEHAALLREAGRAFGTNTGRPRRCGWLDAVLLRQACRIAGVDRLVLTKLDVLDSFQEIRIATAYRIDGREYDCLPALVTQQWRTEPIYETLPGWATSLAGVRRWSDLPANAARYIRRIEQLVGMEVTGAGVGPDRKAMITRER